jgi:hypothetical protein
VEPYKIEIAAAPLVSSPDLQPYVDRVMEAIGIAPLILTDESMVWDFGLVEEELAEVSRKLGFPVTGDDFIYTIAARLRGSD